MLYISCKQTQVREERWDFISEGDRKWHEVETDLSIIIVVSRAFSPSKTTVS